MPSIFNTVKLNIMGFLSAFLKYTILSLAFIMLMIDVVQTRPAGGTRFKITIKGSIMLHKVQINQLSTTTLATSTFPT